MTFSIASRRNIKASAFLCVSYVHPESYHIRWVENSQRNLDFSFCSTLANFQDGLQIVLTILQLFSFSCGFRLMFESIAALVSIQNQSISSSLLRVRSYSLLNIFVLTSRLLILYMALICQTRASYLKKLLYL